MRATTRHGPAGLEPGWQIFCSAAHRALLATPDFDVSTTNTSHATPPARRPRTMAMWCKVGSACLPDLILWPVVSPQYRGCPRRGGASAAGSAREVASTLARCFPYQTTPGGGHRHAGRSQTGWAEVSECPAPGSDRIPGLSGDQRHCRESKVSQLPFISAAIDLSEAQRASLYLPLQRHHRAARPRANSEKSL